MTNTTKLEVAITESGKTKREIAIELGISEMALYNKIHNKAEFKASEIKKIKDCLELTQEQQNEIFFAAFVD